LPIEWRSHKEYGNPYPADQAEFMIQAVIAAVFSLACVVTALAQDAYPARPINLLVPFAPGGTSDVIARLIADEMGRVLGQNIIN